mmetsp:Transcript_15842/g.46844  ORF Transcript_15842/g.46844 Transcript_15842/m.46844 type:complete len:219 (+) Transcript_15842:2697-3353(+)
MDWRRALLGCLLCGDRLGVLSVAIDGLHLVLQALLLLGSAALAAPQNKQHAAAQKGQQDGQDNNQDDQPKRHAAIVLLRGWWRGSDGGSAAGRTGTALLKACCPSITSLASGGCLDTGRHIDQSQWACSWQVVVHHFDQGILKYLDISVVVNLECGAHENHGIAILLEQSTPSRLILQEATTAHGGALRQDAISRHAQAGRDSNPEAVNGALSTVSER